MNIDTNKRTYGVIVSVVAAILIWFGYMWMNAPVEPLPSSTSTSTVGVNTSTEEVGSDMQSITYLVSEQDETLYCNGDDMDSDGYRKTIIQEKTALVPKGNGAQAELAKAILGLATKGNCRTSLLQSNITIQNGVVSIPAIDTWAGVSIALCSCIPQVEVNMLRLPGITKVMWQAEPLSSK